MESKADVRKRLKTQLKNASINSGQHQKLAEQLNSFLHSHCDNFPNNLGVFAPMSNEPNIWDTLKNWEDKLCFPSFVSEGLMEFRKSSTQELQQSKEFGAVIMGPSETKEVVTPDLILIPGLGFSESGQRMGRGKGYYDRYLENFFGLKIGVGFEIQICDSLPSEEHDQAMDYIITEKRILSIREQK